MTARSTVRLTLPYPPAANNLYRTLMMEKRNAGGLPTIEERARLFLDFLRGRDVTPSDLISFAKSEVDRIQAIRVPSGDAKKYKTAVSRICSRTAMNPLLGEIAVNLGVYRPRRVGDLDGTFKAVFDSLTEFAWIDDKQIGEIHAKRHEDKYRPRVEIGITEIEAAQPLFPVVAGSATNEIPF